MGLPIFKPSRSVYEPVAVADRVCGDRPGFRPSGNPNPKNCRVLHVSWVGRAVIVVIEYPDCTNYEGRKVCLYRTAADWERARTHADGIDPHFSKEGPGPFARFEPTLDGIAAAKKLAEVL